MINVSPVHLQFNSLMYRLIVILFNNIISINIKLTYVFNMLDLYQTYSGPIH